MNVNLTSVTESTKLSKGVSEMTAPTDEASEAEGFFAKLTAMLKGDSKPVEEQVIATEDGEAVTSGESADLMLDADNNIDVVKADELVDAEPTQNPAEQMAATDGEQEGSSTEKIPQQLERFIENPTADSPAPSSVEATVAESEALLERLDQANQALRTQDGNSLPPQVDAQLTSNAVESNQTTGDDSQTIKSVDPVATTQAQALSSMPQSADLEEVRPQEQAIGDVVLKEADVIEANQNAQSAAHMVISQSSAVQQVDAPQNAQTNVMVADSIEVPATHTTEFGQTMVQTVGDNDESALETSTEVVPSIAWANTSVSAAADADTIDASMADDGVRLAVAEHSHGKVAHKLTAAELQTLNMLNSQQAAPTANGLSAAANSAVISNTAPASLVPTTPMDLSATQQIPANIAAGVKPEQMALQATLGAKAAATLGKLGQHGEGTNGGESSFAQQLSQVAGQTGLNQTARLEPAAQAQPSLQLNREMAGEQVAERIQMMMSKNLKNIDIRLDPPELGRMQIRMNMNGDNTSVHFTVANSQARDIVEQAMPRLREMLAQQGMQLSDSSVQQQASGQQQSRYSNANDGGNGQGNSSQHFEGQENLEADVKLDLNVASKRDGISYYA